MKRLVPLLALGLAWSLASCDTPIGAGSTGSSSGVRVPRSAPSPATGTGGVSLSPTALRQTIEGFGGADAWRGSLPPTAVIQALFDPSTGAGLTILRNRIPFREDPGTPDNFMNKSSGRYVSTSSGGHRTFSLNWTGSWDLNTNKSLYTAAAAYSTEIRGFSTAWTPPNNSNDLWKDDASGNTVGGTVGTVADYPSVGGVLDTAHYQDYADVLADYAANFEANVGYPLAGVSIQNEPNYLPKTYESCWWTADAFTAFMPYLKSAWKAKGASAPVMAPESFSFTASLVDGVLADEPGTVAIVGLHQYNATGISNPAANYAQASSSFNASWFDTLKTAGKRLWETEVSTTGGTNDASIQDGLYWARMVHADLTVAEVNAFCAWWLWDSGAAALVQVPSSGSPVYNKRLYTIGQFSRFVRPGWVRLDTDTNPASGVETTAFRDPNSNRFAVVIINYSSASVTLPITSSKTMTAELYTTSASDSLADKGALTAGKAVSVTVPALSVSTVSGTW
jgi:O-glycosyl hydrolase